MSARNSVVLTVSVPPEVAGECRELAKARGESLSSLFREMLIAYKQERLKEDFYALQRYGARRAGGMELTEKAVERLVFEGR